jgi:hypothetical protein
MRTWTRYRHLPIILFTIGALAIGLFVAPHYGESWDEADIYRYSEYALRAYRYLLQPSTLPPFDTNLNLYGPGYYMAASVVARVLVAVHPAWSLVNAWHVVFFITFLGGVITLYLLSARWMSPLSATGAALLFTAQPLLWGHAFINPKDIPFMALFAAAVYCGLRMVDAQAKSSRLLPTIGAAIMLGLSSSFRVLGPLAGLIVLGYAVHKLGRRAWRLAGAYLAITAATAYLSWPYLWAAPVARYLDSIRTMAQFPFASSILFSDHLYKADQLPATYFPVLLGLQMTEPAVLLMAAGLAIAAHAALSRGARGPLVLFLAWFLFPAALILGLRSPLYDNARQLYFLLPPLFILAGLALERLLALVQQPAARAAILALAALPGIALGVRLHPYEYIYYNALVGGTGGAYRHFEMDYWGLSFKEISDYLNSHADQGARVLVYGPEQIMEHYARPDIRLAIPRDDAAPTVDYVVFLTRANVDERRCKDAQTVFSVGRRGAVFSVVKIVPVGALCK